MAWRMIFRRSPNRWMTLVGDPAQTGSPAGVEDWATALEPFVKDRWKLHELTVNYRTPADIAEIATRILAEVAPGQDVPACLRDTGSGVREFQMTGLPDAVSSATDSAGEGLVGIIAAPQRIAGLEQEFAADAVLVSDVNGAKGLEFDEVVLVEPEEIVSASPQGFNDLYVAVTRATQGLSLVHDLPLPW